MRRSAAKSGAGSGPGMGPRGPRSVSTGMRSRRSSSSSRQFGRSKSTGKHSRSVRQRSTQSMSKRGIQTQKLPHASVFTVAITSRRQLNGNSQLHGEPTGWKANSEQSVSSTCTVASGTGICWPVVASVRTTLPHTRCMKSQRGSSTWPSLAFSSATG